MGERQKFEPCVEHRWWTCSIGGGPYRVFAEQKCSRCGATRKNYTEMKRRPGPNARGLSA